MKLQPMTDFVLDQLSIKQSTSEFKEVVRNYATFLKQPLTLGMFVPCDEHNIPLPYFISNEWFKAKEKVLFEGFRPCITNGVQSVEHDKVCVHFALVKGKTIESIVNANIELTPSALKTIGI
ncbi:hypothetical protein HHL23_09370 [Chryseobacterium sp. RP-3-3]|uniref:Uncharacterized protein n=1 Tax=Chryseobacterium antibioticum TaxID=2728847 RepID=A0A7Y0AMI8_9FLAO|nr:hypothetical protein [Chryseobacterium antibioticum]NML70009.1 hypothetical protein [Chryseobacterium antibioticum]